MIGSLSMKWRTYSWQYERLLFFSRALYCDSTWLKYSERARSYSLAVKPPRLARRISRHTVATASFTWFSPLTMIPIYDFLVLARK